VDEHRHLPWDWSDLTIPVGIKLDHDAYVETAYSFLKYRSDRTIGLSIARGASAYGGCMFDLGPRAEVRVGEFSLLNGVWILADRSVTIGHHCLISWDVVIMDTYQWSTDNVKRQTQTEDVAKIPGRSPIAQTGEARPVSIGNNVWVGFGSIILPGVHIGEGSVIGSRSVVVDDVPPFAVYGGNPARFLKSIAPQREPR
jgi:acetyltransferase-like isoleucine patch superfamily enzyme